MTLEGRVAEYLSHKRNRKPDASKNINECPAPQKKDDYHSCLYFFWGFLWHKLLSKHPPLGKATELFWPNTRRINQHVFDPANRLYFSRNLDKANGNIPCYFNDLSIPRKYFNKISVAEAVSTYIKPQNYPCENKKARFLTFVFRKETNSTHIPKNRYSFSFRGLYTTQGRFKSLFESIQSSSWKQMIILPIFQLFHSF